MLANNLQNERLVTHVKVHPYPQRGASLQQCDGSSQAKFTVDDPDATVQIPGVRGYDIGGAFVIEP